MFGVLQRHIPVPITAEQDRIRTEKHDQPFRAEQTVPEDEGQRGSVGDVPEPGFRAQQRPRIYPMPSTSLMSYSPAGRPVAQRAARTAPTA